MKLVKCGLLVLECDSKAKPIHRAVIKPPNSETQRGSGQESEITREKMRNSDWGIWHDRKFALHSPFPNPHSAFSHRCFRRRLAAFANRFAGRHASRWSSSCKT